jgi:hypothetical protein
MTDLLNGQLQGQFFAMVTLVNLSYYSQIAVDVLADLTLTCR